MLNWMIAAVVVVLTLGFLAFVAFREDGPDAQRLLVKNKFADAKCSMQFANGAAETFSVRKGGEWKKTYKNPRPGFIIARCQTADRTIELPNSFHLMSHALAQIEIREDGAPEFTLRQDAQ